MPRLSLPAHGARRWILLASLTAGAVLTIGSRRLAAAGIGFNHELERSVAPLRVKYRRPAPAAAPTAQEAALIALGRDLFFDRQLSSKRDLSCGSCHDPAFGWTDTLPTARGTGGTVGGRRTQTLFEIGGAAAMFWDGRAETLEQQALMPVAAPGEMNMPIEQLRERLLMLEYYRARATSVFGDSVLTPERVAQAIARFERTIHAAPSPFDRWTAGQPTAISDDAKRGLLLFDGKAGCAACHSGWRLTDDSFHDIGTQTTDKGRGAVLEGIDAVQYAFKTPTLRGVAGRAPYLHNGSERDLESVVALYNAGGRVARPSLSPNVHPLGLSADEQRQIVAFLRTLGNARETAPSTSSR